MFRLTRSKPTFVRILDVPNKMYIEPNFIATPLPDGKLMIIHGNFDGITDANANLHVQNALDKIAS